MGPRSGRDWDDAVVDFGLAVSTALDPVLVPHGFAAGQSGSDQVVYCAGHDDLSDRFPRLPQANAQTRSSGCCIDFVVERSDHGVLWMDLEGASLAGTLQVLGLDDDAAHLGRTARAPVDTTLPVLTDVLTRMFRAAGA